MSKPEENLSDFERNITNIEENMSSLEDDMPSLDENMANQTPPPRLIRIKHKRKAKPSTPPSNSTSPTPKAESLAPGEIVLDVEVAPSLAKPNGCDVYYLGDARKPDLNSHPAALGMPNTRMGFYNVATGKTSVVCPMCFQSFTTTTVLESGHLEPGGPCENFRRKLEAPQKTLKKGKGKVEEVDDEHHGFGAGEDYEMTEGEHLVEGGELYQESEGGAGNTMNEGDCPSEGAVGNGISEGNQQIEGCEGIQGSDQEETYLGFPMEEIFPGYRDFEGGRDYLGRDLGEGPLPGGEDEDHKFELPERDEGSETAEGMAGFWAYQGFEGLPGFEGNWSSFGPEDGAGFPGFGMSGR
ncbi:hypothetical protein N431DRAFT_461208 [Stipitochalara longipes BDJ]|nr:hypothetical protein N431DRAFT_461208 [Stipitochalara longipes BDJ]